MKILILIPVYNEMENIERVYQNLVNAGTLEFCDCLFINDGSSDDSERVLKEKSLRFLNIAINLGVGAAMQLGYKYAYKKNYDCAIQFDGDGQHRAEDILKLVEKIENGYDIAIGSRFLMKKKNYSLRMLGSRIISGLIFLTTFQKITDPTSGFRAISKKRIKEYAFDMKQNPEPVTLHYQLIKKSKIAEVQVEMNERVAGISTYSNLFNSVKYMIKVCISIIFRVY